MLALLLVLITLFGFSSGSSGTVATIPAAPAPAPAARAPAEQPALAPAKRRCLDEAPRPEGRLKTPCSAYSPPKP